MTKNLGNSIKGDRRFEALRDQGMSKESAARIANTDATTEARRVGHSKPYNQWTQRELSERAKEVGIDGRSKMRRGNLVAALRHH